MKKPSQMFFLGTGLCILAAFLTALLAGWHVERPLVVIPLTVLLLGFGLQMRAVWLSRLKPSPFEKRLPGKGETLCPYDGVAYWQVPNYVSGYGCPVCNAIGPYHLPVPVGTKR